jgi:hypothetical protein
MTREALVERLQRGQEVVLEDSVVKKVFPGTLELSSRDQIQAFCDERFTAYRHDEKTGKHHFIPRGY